MAPVIAGHRGLDEFAPENTAPAFVAAWELGMGIEFDVQLSRDGELVVIHDPTLERTTDGSGAVVDHDLAALKAVDAGLWRGEQFAGERILTLDETFALAAKHGRASTTLVLEAKVDEPGMAKSISDLLSRHGLMERTAVIGASVMAIDAAESRHRYREADASFPAAVAVNEPDEMDMALSDEYSSWLYVRFVPSPIQVERIHATGKRVIASGLNVMNIVDRAYAAMISGSDVVLSNHPVALLGRWHDHVRA
jgi:glycerophosphoryl diester phosphodiesterase